MRRRTIAYATATALLVAKTGGKSYQFRYKLNGKGQTATIGKVDVMSLAEARGEADKLRKLAAKGEHLTTAKRVAKAETVAASTQTFKATAADWVKSEARRKKWSAEYVDEVEQSLRNHLAKLDPLPVSKIVASITAPIEHAVEMDAPGMAERVSRRLRTIMDYAVEQAYIVSNPLPRRRGAKVDRRHFAAVVDLPGIGNLLRTVDALPDPNAGARRAHQLLVYTAQRISEVVGARWDEFALDGVDVPIGDTRRFRSIQRPVTGRSRASA